LLVFFAAATSNYLRLQSLISAEDAALISLHNLPKFVDPKKAEQLADAIDAYMIAVLDHEILTYAPFVRQELRAVIEIVDSISCADPAGVAVLQILQGSKISLFSLNGETALAAQRVINKSHWTIISILAISIIILLFGLRDGSLLSFLFTAAVIVVVFLTIRLLNDIDNNTFLAGHLAFEAPQYVFKSIGKLSYYPEIAFSLNPRLAPQVPYRVGVYKKFGKSFEKRIKVVRKKP